MPRFSCLNILALLLLGVIVGFGAGHGFAQWREWLNSYTEAERSVPVAAEFATALADRLREENVREVRWPDLAALLAEQRFAPLRKGAFTPSPEGDVLVIFRINDPYELPLTSAGHASLRDRPK